jgi:aminopeptidase YwaD
VTPKSRFASLLLAAMSVLPAAVAGAQQPFLPEQQWNALRDEASGTAPYENLRVLTGLHRVPATPQFDQAADFMLRRAREYGLQSVQSEQFPVDGQVHYGLMRSYFAWAVTEAQLWQQGPQHLLIADWATDPIRLADYSHSADVEAPLIDVGTGTAESDYAGKDVRGKIVLADGVLSEVQSLAVMKLGAAGIVSDMQNQATAWSSLNTDIVRWGHLDATQPQGFAFMVSRAGARALRAQMSDGHTVTLRAHVQAEVGPGHWTVVSAAIPGTLAASDPRYGEIVYSCHLDHQRPGANDNGSGCVTILEAARLLNHLIETGRLPRPARTLRFVWGPEIEGTMAYLSRHPEVRRALRADVHMDMVGGDPFKNKSMLHVTQTPWSLPSFVTDLGMAFAETIRDAAAVYAEDGSHETEAVLENRDGAPGTRNEFLVDETPYAEGSDHDDYDSSTIAVPSLYLRDWPDIYIHTDHDLLEQIDASKLRRVALLGAASGYTLAALDGTSSTRLVAFFAARAQQRLARGFERAQALVQDAAMQPGDAWYEAHNLLAQQLRREVAALRSFAALAGTEPRDTALALKSLQTQSATLEEWTKALAAKRGVSDFARRPEWTSQAAAARVPRRSAAPRVGGTPTGADFGPLTYQNDDVLLDRLGAARVAKIALLGSDSSHLIKVQNSGALYAYEIVNFIDGKRTGGEIRDAVAAEFGPIPLEAVSDYLRACEEAKLITLR